MIWLICAGGSLGAEEQDSAGDLDKKKAKTIFPLPTLIINIIGSFLLGLFANLNKTGMVAESLYCFLGIGFSWGFYNLFNV